MLKECNICFLDKKEIWHCQNDKCTAIVCQSCHQDYQLICGKTSCPFCNPLEKRLNYYDIDNSDIEYFEDDFGIFDLDFENEIDSAFSEFYQLLYLISFCGFFYYGFHY